MRRVITAFILAVLLTVNAEPAKLKARERIISVGYSPNMLQAQALIAQNMAEEGKDWFASYLPPGVTISWQGFSSASEVTESLTNGVTDFAYVEPCSVLSSHLTKDVGQNLVAVSAGVRGGVALLARAGADLYTPTSFRNKKIVVSHPGSTQDISLRHWLLGSGTPFGLAKIDSEIIAVPSFHFSSLLQKEAVDAAWAMEPWVSMMEIQANARLIYVPPPRCTLTSVLAAKREYLLDEKNTTERFIQAHNDLTQWIAEHREEAGRRIVTELTRQWWRSFPSEVVSRAWPRLVFEATVSPEDFEPYIQAMRMTGHLKKDHKFNDLVYRPRSMPAAGGSR